MRHGRSGQVPSSKLNAFATDFVPGASAWIQCEDEAAGETCDFGCRLDHCFITWPAHLDLILAADRHLATQHGPQSIDGFSCKSIQKPFPLIQQFSIIQLLLRSFRNKTLSGGCHLTSFPNTQQRWASTEITPFNNLI